MGWRRAACIAVSLTACSFTPGVLPTALVDAPPIDPDMTIAPVCTDNVCTLRFDTDTEWADRVALRDGYIDAAALAPGAFVYGFLIGRGSALPHGMTSVDWTGIDGATVAGVTLSGPNHPAGSTTPPRGIGIANNMSWTYWLEGELLLTAGQNAFELLGQDIASVQIAQPGTRDFMTILNATAGTPATGMFDAGAGGWFPIRVAVVQTNGGESGLALRTGADMASLARIRRGQMRARVDGMRGSFLLAWEDRRMGSRMTPSLYERPLIQDTIDAPLAPGLTIAENLTHRWVGQVYADVAGTYTLQTLSDDGNRVYFAGQPSQDKLLDVASNVMTDVTASLRRGWNDIVVDYIEETGAESMQLLLTAAPAGVATGGPIPVAQLRPAWPRQHRVVHFTDRPQRAIPNNNATGISETFDPDVFAGEVIREVRVSYQLQHGQLSEVDVELTHDGVTAVLRDSTSNANRWHAPTGFNGQSLAGVWTLRVDDEGGGTTGSLEAWSLTLITQNGPGHISETTEWISTVKDLGALAPVVALQSLSATLVPAPGASAEVYIRTCDAPTGCAAEAWSGPATSGQPIDAPVRRYAQLRVVLLSNGSDDPAVDAVELVYRVMP